MIISCVVCGHELTDDDTFLNLSHRADDGKITPVFAHFSCSYSVADSVWEANQKFRDECQIKESVEPDYGVKL